MSPACWRPDWTDLPRLGPPAGASVLRWEPGLRLAPPCPPAAELAVTVPSLASAQNWFGCLWFPYPGLLLGAMPGDSGHRLQPGEAGSALDTLPTWGCALCFRASQGEAGPCPRGILGAELPMPSNKSALVCFHTHGLFPWLVLAPPGPQRMAPGQPWRPHQPPPLAAPGRTSAPHCLGTALLTHFGA